MIRRLVTFTLLCLCLLNIVAQTPLLDKCRAEVLCLYHNSWQKNIARVGMSYEIYRQMSCTFDCRKGNISSEQKKSILTNDKSQNVGPQQKNEDSAYHGYLLTDTKKDNCSQRCSTGYLNMNDVLRLYAWKLVEGADNIRESRTTTIRIEYLQTDKKERTKMQLLVRRYKVRETEKKLILAKNNSNSVKGNKPFVSIVFKKGIIVNNDIIGDQTIEHQA